MNEDIFVLDGGLNPSPTAWIIVSIVGFAILVISIVASHFISSSSSIRDAEKLLTTMFLSFIGLIVGFVGVRGYFEVPQAYHADHVTVDQVIGSTSDGSVTLAVDGYVAPVVVSTASAADLSGLVHEGDTVSLTGCHESDGTDGMTCTSVSALQTGAQGDSASGASTAGDADLKGVKVLGVEGPTSDGAYLLTLGDALTSVTIFADDGTDVSDLVHEGDTVDLSGCVTREVVPDLDVTRTYCPASSVTVR